MPLVRPLQRFSVIVWSNLHTNDLWQRIVKYAIAAVIAVIIAILPPVIQAYGSTTFLTPVTTVFAHPGQRMGLMIESLLMIIFGSMLGLSWSLLGLYLSNLASEYNTEAGFAIRAMFLLVAVLFHGFLRSFSPRLFVFVLFLLIVAVMTLVGEASVVTTELAVGFIYPILTGAGILLVINLSIFPELSSSFLGITTIENLSEVSDTLNRATAWFVTPGGDSEELKALDEEANAPVPKRGKKTKEARARAKRRKNRAQKFLSGFENPFQTAKKTISKKIPPHLTRLINLTDSKAKLRARLSRCRAAQNEVNFEISISALAPALLKPISSNIMTCLVQNIITLIGACENKFVVLGHAAASGDVADEGPAQDQFDTRLPGGDQDHEEPLPGNPYDDFMKKRARVNRAKSTAKSAAKDEYMKQLQAIKPLREIEAADAGILESMLVRVRGPVEEFVEAIRQAVGLTIQCVAYCYDVPRLPSGAKAPSGIPLAEIDIRVDMFTDALAKFDKTSTAELEKAAQSSEEAFDMMPRMETFLVSSFLLGIRQAAMHVLQMLQQARALVEKRQARKDRSRVYLPHYTSIKQWLSTGGEEDGMVLPEGARKEARSGQALTDVHDEDKSASSVSDEPLIRPRAQMADEENIMHRVGTFKGTVELRKAHKKDRQRKRKIRKHRRKHQVSGWWGKVRTTAADTFEWLQDSEDLTYAFKLAIAVFLVSWPGFTRSWNPWYSEVRGVWAPLQLILVFEVAIGTSLFVFCVRLFGVIFGCLVGYLSYEISRGNRAVIVAVLVFGIVPSIYIQVGTKYVKAGMISIVSMVVVALGTSICALLHAAR